jgi:hypothetical protein
MNMQIPIPAGLSKDRCQKGYLTFEVMIKKNDDFHLVEGASLAGS